MAHLLSEVKHALHIGDPTDDPERVAKEIHAAQASHEKEEAKANRLIVEAIEELTDQCLLARSQRNANKKNVLTLQPPVLPTSSLRPPSSPPSLTAVRPIPSFLELLHNLTILTSTESLAEVAHDPTHVHEKKQTTPDLEGVTHIPESELPPRLPCV
ncbi:hypothetical protein JCM10295v2_007193 [Rhodotorula toruloides]